ncbi:TetR/AcrR family transcriptional regulator [uncultured Microscilla sp.]|uniref:TetR/AcrR family transcriptional regulator n=1 Tax=uncultured Microscilla sp. TaxID=432653 RepID=UPI00260997DF|nr:TetR/AcrR family transcriptional regulator [uncultured Microscilla sp.]
MIKDKQMPWVLAGYQLFAQAGPQGLKVEVIARKVQKSKSSFYHHFADLEVFTEFLLHYHLHQAALIAERENQCKNIAPDLVEVLVDAKQDLLFNRQLRVHRQVEAFRLCFEKSTQYVNEAFLQVWALELGIAPKVPLAQNMLDLLMENFYLQITAENLTHEWLSDYFIKIKATVKDLIQSAS